MKISVSMSAEDLATIDATARRRNLPSRSAVLQEAIRGLRNAELSAEYDVAFAEWSAEDAELWSRTTSDGITG
jgi:Arc/MetJ-type ribon-helix-helix transcriptional regulator